jgi:hypothetical protein
MSLKLTETPILRYELALHRPASVHHRTIFQPNASRTYGLGDGDGVLSIRHNSYAVSVELHAVDGSHLNDDVNSANKNAIRNLQNYSAGIVYRSDDYRKQIRCPIESHVYLWFANELRACTSNNRNCGALFAIRTPK